MKKKYITFSIVTLVLLVALITSFNYFKTTNTYVENNSNNQTKITKGISMNLEQTAGAGDYKTVTQSGWPTEGYKFNTELSRCENGSTLSWDDTKKAVIVSGNLSDKCYVYFDIYVPPRFDETCDTSTLACYIAKQYTGTQGDNSLYYHDSNLTNGAGDNSYRYAGANPNNFVCFGSDASPCPTDNLYRIIGVFGEGYHGVSEKQLVKLIKYDYANSNLLGTDGDYVTTSTPDALYYKGSLTTIYRYYWNYYKATNSATNTWSTSLLNKTNLNTNFINNIGTTWANKIATVTWKVGGNTYANISQSVPATTYQNEIVNPVTTNTTDNATTYSAKIGLMYVSEYGFATEPSAWTTKLYSYDGSVNGSTIRSQNWMHMGYYDWTISRNSDYSYIAFIVNSTGDVHHNNVGNYIGVRPSFNLESSVSYVSGLGSMSDPIVIN